MWGAHFQNMFNSAPSGFYALIEELRSGGPRLKGTQVYPRRFASRVFTLHKKFKALVSSESLLDSRFYRSITKFKNELADMTASS